MDVAQFLDAFCFRPDVEIVISREPEGTTLRLAELACNILLEHLQRERELSSFRFSDEQVNMLGHDYVRGNVKSVPLPHSFQSLLEEIAGAGSAQTSLAVAAAECNDVQTAGFLKPL